MFTKLCFDPTFHLHCIIINQNKLWCWKPASMKYIEDVSYASMFPQPRTKIYQPHSIACYLVYIGRQYLRHTLIFGLNLSMGNLLDIINSKYNYSNICYSQTFVLGRNTIMAMLFTFWVWWTKNYVYIYFVCFYPSFMTMKWVCIWKEVTLLLLLAVKHFESFVVDRYAVTLAV